MHNDEGHMTLEGEIPSELGNSKTLKFLNMSKCFYLIGCKGT